jgi:hypothetical protein
MELVVMPFKNRLILWSFSVILFVACFFASLKMGDILASLIY